jgi:uncharacterized membrane protein
MKRASRWSLKNSLLTGLAAIMPLALTVFVLYLCWHFVDKYVAAPINNKVKDFLLTESGAHVLRQIGWSDSLLGDPEALKKAVTSDYPDFLGFAVAFVLVVLALYLLGHIQLTYLGNRLFLVAEQALARLPVVNRIYPYGKRVTEFLFGGEKERGFSRVVAVEYPRKGVYSLAFATGETPAEIVQKTGRKMVNVFVPSSPVPISGFVILVPEDDIIPLSLTVDEAFGLLTTLGVGTPQRKRLPNTLTDVLSPPGASGDPAKAGPLERPPTA